MGKKDMSAFEVTTKMERSAYADAIVERLGSVRETAKAEFARAGQVSSFVVDDLLDPDWAMAIYEAFPPKEQLKERKTIREHKFTGAQMDRYPRAIEDITFAFQDARVLALIGEITGIPGLLPDEHLYAGGISLMAKGNFLNPHLDNSHDKDCARYRVLNLLYYTTPAWEEHFGGNLELWDQGPRESARTIHSKFNRLVVMATNRTSWHSVSEVRHEGQRTCVSNYFFANAPLEQQKYYHVTTFRGRPEQALRDLVLQADNTLRNAVRRVFRQGQGVLDTDHVYRK